MGSIPESLWEVQVSINPALMQKLRTGIFCGALACSLWLAAKDAENVDARVDEVTRNLRPPVSFVGDPTWTLKERMAHYGVPGVSIAVVDGSKVVWTRAFGLADRESGEKVRVDTLFQAGSVSKPVAALGALRMVAAGELDLDQPVNERLKSWRVPHNDFTKKMPVTLSQLLSHTAGLTVHGFPGYAVDAKVPTMVEILDGRPPANTAAIVVDQLPGSAWRYSGGGYTVAQLLMTEVARQPFAKLMKSRVLEPIGMRDSSFDNPLPRKLLPRAAAGILPDGTAVAGKRHTYPEMAAAGLWTTSKDLGLFGIEMQRALGGKSDLLSKALAEDMLSPRLDSGYGLGFGISEVNGESYFGHGGWDEGFCAHRSMHRSKGRMRLAQRLISIARVLA